MSAPPETTVIKLFDELEPQATSARSHQGMLGELIALHAVVGRRYAEHVYMTLSSDPAFIDCSMSEGDMGKRLQAYRDALLFGAAKVREARNANDDVTRRLAEARMFGAYFARYGTICTRTCLTPRGGRA